MFLICCQSWSIISPAANCLRTEGTSRYVQVYNEATKEIRNVDVEVGLSGDDKVAVSSPELKEGDKILVKAAKATQTNSNRMGGPPMH